MEKILDKDQVRAQLEAKSEEINYRLDAIQNEVATVGQAIRDAVYSHPLISIGGSIAAGLLVGFLLGGPGKRGKHANITGVEDRYKSLIDEYVNAVAEEVKKHARTGIKADDAVRKALRDRVPVIFYEVAQAQEGRRKQGLLADTFELAYKTALGFAVKLGIDFVTSRLHLDALAERIEAGEGADAAAPVAAIVSDDAR